MSASEKILQIHSIFLKAKEMASSISNYQDLKIRLLNFDKEFISIAYEAASAAIAIKDMEQSSSLENWKLFYAELGQQHATQVHVGLGWAFSETSTSLSNYDSHIDPYYLCRVIDGIGYYDGMLKRRESIRQQIIPDRFKNHHAWAYNQGLGRSLWYFSKGNSERLIRVIKSFPQPRQPHFWRGVGTAVAYVGGTSMDLMDTLCTSSENYAPSFKCGIALAAYSRFISKSASVDTENACLHFLRASGETIYTRLTELGKKLTAAENQRYYEWITAIESLDLINT